MLSDNIVQLFSICWGDSKLASYAGYSVPSFCASSDVLQYLIGWHQPMPTVIYSWHELASGYRRHAGNRFSLMIAQSWSWATLETYHCHLDGDFVTELQATYTIYYMDFRKGRSRLCELHEVSEGQELRPGSQELSTAESKYNYTSSHA